MSGTGDEVFGPPKAPYHGAQTEPSEPEFGPQPAGNLQPQDEQYYGNVEDLVTPFDKAAADRSRNLQQEYAKALSDGDIGLANGLLRQQIEQAKISQARVEALGLPPETRAPNNAFPNTAVEMQRLVNIAVHRQTQVDMVLDKMGWSEMEDWFQNDVIKPYTERNESQLQVDTAGMDESQRIFAQEQLEPLVMDPMMVADRRQRLVQIDQELKKIHPNLSVHNIDRTRSTAGWIAREADLGGGYIQSGEIEGVGFLGETGGEVAATALAGAEAALDFPLEFIYGPMDLMAAAPPSNYVEGPNGEIVTNAGKIPNLTETWIAVSAQLSGRNVAEELARHGKLAQVEASRLSTVQEMGRGVASVIGMGIGFGKVAGGFMNTGQQTAIGMMQHGLTRLAVSGHPKAARALQIMAGTAGAAVGNGLAEMVAFGRHEGAWKAFQGGAAMAPVLMAFGAAGRRVGRRADQAWGKMLEGKRMPQRLRLAIEGGIEGLGFGVMEDFHNYREFEGSLWEYLKDPTKARWQIYATNVLGMAIFKGVAKHGPLDRAEPDAETITRSRKMFRRLAARKVSEAERPESSGELIKEAQRVGEEVEAEMRLSPEEAEYLREGPKDAPLPEHLTSTEQVPKQDRPMSSAEIRSEIQRLKREGPLKGNAKRVAELAEQLRGRLTQAAAGEVQRRIDVEVQAGQREAPKRELTEEQQMAEKAKAAGDQVGRAPTTEEMAAELERMRLEDEAEARGELFTRESKERGFDELQARSEKTYREKADEVRRQLGELPPEDFPGKTSRTEAQEKLRRSAAEMGVDYELLKQLGDELRIAEDESVPASRREEAYRRVQEIEADLDRQEALSDPELNDALEQNLRQAEIAARIDIPELTPESSTDPSRVRPIFGERYGPSSMRAGANPYRQQKRRATEESLDEALDRTLNEIFQIMEGRRAKKGFKLPFVSWRVGGKKGSPVQVSMLEGNLLIAGGTKGTLGVFKIYENLVRTKEGLDLVVGLHEWSHAMHRQLYVGKGGDAFWKGVLEQFHGLSDAARDEIPKILEHYPGWEKMRPEQLLAEAWAEWFAREALGDPNLRTETPELSKVFGDWLNAPEQRAFRDGQWRDLVGAVRQWRDIGSRERVGLTVQRATRQERTYDKRPVEGRVDQIVRAFFDANTLLKKSQERWLERADVKPEDLSILMDPSRMIDSVSMTSQKEAESFMLKGPHDLAYKRKRDIQSFKEVMDGVTEGYRGKSKNQRIIDFVDLVYSIRAMELMDRGKKMPLPKSDYIVAAKEILEANPDFENRVGYLKQWTDSLLDLVGEAAQVPAKELQAMKDAGTVYLPFVRVIRNSVSRFGESRGVAERGTGMKAFRGGSREEIMDPVRAMEDVTRSLITNARRALVMRSLYKLMLHADVGGLVSQVPKGKVASRFRLDQMLSRMKKALDKRIADKEDEIGSERTEELQRDFEEQFGLFGQLLEANELTDTMVTLFGQKDLPIGEKEPILAMVPHLTEGEINAIPSSVGRKQARQNNGKMVWLQVEPGTFQALMGLNTPLTRWGMGDGLLNTVVTAPKSWLRTFATDANPAFVFANLMRDAVHASVFDREGKLVPFKGFALLGRGAYLQLRYGSWMTKRLDAMFEGNPEAREMWERYEASGAVTSSFFNEGLRREIRGEVQSLRSRTSTWFDRWKMAMAAPESWIRVAEYERVFRRARKQDKSELEAAYEALEGAREVTVNFARAGDVARWYNQMTPYFSATLAAQRKMMRAFLGMEGRSDIERAAYQRRVWAQAMVNVTLPAVAIWYSQKDEDWYQDLPEWRKRNYVNFLDPLGSGEVISLPLPFETGTIFGSIPISFLESETDGNPISVSRAFRESLMPYLEHTSSLWPAFVRPLAEVYSDKDFFRNKPLTPFWLEKTKTPDKQVTAGTTKIAQALFRHFPGAALIADNPIEVEQIIGGYTANFGRTIMRAIDEVSGLKDHPGMSLNPLSRFTRQTPHGQSRTVDDLYEEGKRLEQVEKTDRSPAERLRLTRINQAKQEFARLRQEVELARLSQEEADTRMFQIAFRIMGWNQ